MKMDASLFQQNITESGDDYDYSQYYDYGDEPLESFGICENIHINSFGRIFIPISYSIICFLSIVGNVLLIVTLIKSKHPRKLFPLSMAISDILFAMTLPFWTVYAHHDWMFGKDACKAVTAVYIATLYSRILFLTCISMDGYLGVVWTLSNKNHRTPMRTAVVCTVVWIFALLAAAPHWIFVEALEYHGHRICTYHFGDDHSPLWKIFINFQLNIFGFLIPVLIMLFCYLRVYFAFAKLKVGEKSKAQRLVMMVVVAFILLWFPYNLVSFLHSLQVLRDVIFDCATSVNLQFAIQVTECIAFSHGFINPFLYAFVNKRIWKCLAKMCVGGCNRTSEYVLESTNSADTSLVQIAMIERHLENIHNLQKDAEERTDI